MGTPIARNLARAGNPDEVPDEYVTWLLEITPLKRDEDIDCFISGLKGLVYRILLIAASEL